MKFYEPPRSNTELKKQIQIANTLRAANNYNPGAGYQGGNVYMVGGGPLGSLVQNALGAYMGSKTDDALLEAQQRAQTELPGMSAAPAPVEAQPAPVAGGGASPVEVQTSPAVAGGSSIPAAPVAGPSTGQGPSNPVVAALRGDTPATAAYTKVAPELSEPQRAQVLPLPTQQNDTLVSDYRKWAMNNLDLPGMEEVAKSVLMKTMNRSFENITRQEGLEDKATELNWKREDAATDFKRDLEKFATKHGYDKEMLALNFKNDVEKLGMQQAFQRWSVMFQEGQQNARHASSMANQQENAGKLQFVGFDKDTGKPIAWSPSMGTTVSRDEKGAITPYSGNMTGKSEFYKSQKEAETASTGIGTIDDLVSSVEKNPGSFGSMAAASSFLPNAIRSRVESATMSDSDRNVRNRVINEAADLIHKRYGAALSGGEKKIAESYIPTTTDDAKSAAGKLRSLSGYLSSKVNKRSTVGGGSPAGGGTAPAGNVVKWSDLK